MHGVDRLTAGGTWFGRLIQCADEFDADPPKSGRCIHLANSAALRAVLDALGGRRGLLTGQRRPDERAV